MHTSESVRSLDVVRVFVEMKEAKGPGLVPFSRQLSCMRWEAAGTEGGFWLGAGTEELSVLKSAVSAEPIFGIHVISYS